MKYAVVVQQDIKSWSDGYITIEADSEDDAFNKVSAMSQDELVKIVEWDTPVNDIEDDGDIKVLREFVNIGSKQIDSDQAYDADNDPQDEDDNIRM